jgi:hypothetical protein
MVFIQGTTLLVGCEWTFEFLELCYVKSHHELKDRALHLYQVVSAFQVAR